MGVPAFFRWLSKKYASIVVHCTEEKSKEIDGTKIPVDTSQKNPNDIEFDNLYLDMNGIIHPCTHPENKPAPKNEAEMMVDIFEYIDRIFSIVRPRRLLYMAIDGVAPRAKMNQQRSRRFRASKESMEKRDEMARIKDMLRSKGLEVPPDKPAGEHFDSNCITPGTDFMFRLADCLRYYVHARLNSDPGWQGIKVILSDANVPGEGEHKIMDYIRKQRAQPDHDPNTHHCLCGADADLIMLGLATHEPYFTIIREEFKPNQPRPCELCGQIGHEMKECQGLPKEKEGEHDEMAKTMGAETEFIFIRLTILREYLEKELQMTNLPFKQDIERAIDDWVFMCFFVGNDFLPHLPSLEIREGAIDRLVTLYKKAVYKTGGYLTDSGIVNLERCQLVLADLGEVEDEIFKQRRENELEFQRRQKMKKLRTQQFQNSPRYIPGGQFGAVKPLMGGPPRVENAREAARQSRVEAMNYSNKEAAGALKSMFVKEGEGGSSSSDQGTKRKAEEQKPAEEEEPHDEVKLWEDGWKDRYYQSKFGVDVDDVAFRHQVANEYVLGLCWVLRYYYQGCPSWKWYFPYHYAPFASDFINIGDLKNEFEKFTQPFKPLEQLMGVFPAASKKFLPPSWQVLMWREDSPIIDFYPEDFKIDLNGKKYAWQGVALLPFVDEVRLKKQLAKVYPDLSQEETARNIRGNDRLFVSKKNPAFSFLEAIYEGEKAEKPIGIDTTLTTGMGGSVWADEFVVMPGEDLPSPVPQLSTIKDNQCMMVHYLDPEYDVDFLFPAKLLPTVKMPDKVLKPEDFNRRFPGQQWRPQTGFQKGSHYRGGRNMSAANRFIKQGVGYGGQDQGVTVGPPQYYTDRERQRGNRGGGGGGGGGRACFKCGEEGHMARECPGAGGGGGARGFGGGGGGGWNRNMQGQGNAWQQNQSRGYQQGGWGGNQGNWGGNQGNWGGGNQGGWGGNQGGGYGGNQGNWAANQGRNNWSSNNRSGGYNQQRRY